MNAASHSNGERRALITGLDSFTGSYLARELKKRGFLVSGTTRKSVPDSAENLYTVDLGDKAELTRIILDARPDIIVHLAAISFVAHNDVDAMYTTNVLGSRNLLEALSGSQHVPSKVMLASSAAVYGNTDVDPIDEAVVPAPANDYAVSKLSMEYVASLWSGKLPLVIARPFNYTGAGQSDKFLLPKIVSHFRAGKPSIELGNIDIARDFSDVRRVSAAYVKLLEGDGLLGTFNVCSGVSHSLTDVLHMMEKIAGYKIQVSINPSFVRPNDVKRVTGSCSKLMSAVGPLPQYSLLDTLSWMYREG